MRLATTCLLLPMGALSDTETVLGSREYEVETVLSIVSAASNETVLSASPGGGALVTMLVQEEDQR